MTTHTKWLKLTRLLHITGGSFLKKIVAVILVFCNMPTFAVLADEPLARSAEVGVLRAELKEQSQNENLFDNYDPRFDEQMKLLDMQRTDGVYQEDVSDKNYIDSLSRHPLPLIDARAVGRLKNPFSVNPVWFTSYIRFGKFFPMEYSKYSEVVIELTAEERDIINFAYMLMFYEGAVDYDLKNPVTLYKLLRVAVDIKRYGRDLDMASEHLYDKVIAILNKNLYY